MNPDRQTLRGRAATGADTERAGHVRSFDRLPGEPSSSSAPLYDQLFAVDARRPPPYPAVLRYLVMCSTVGDWFANLWPITLICPALFYNCYPIADTGLAFYAYNGQNVL